MSKQELPNNEPIDVSYDEDYQYELFLQQENLNEQYWENKSQETIDTINSIYDTRFCYADVIGAIMEVTNDSKLAKELGDKLNELYIRRLTFDSYGIQ